MARRERYLVLTFLGFVCIALAHFVYAGWYDYFFHAGAPDPKHDLFAGTDYAPVQYRLAMPYLSRFLARIFCVGKMAAVFAALDLVAGYAAMYLLYLRLVGVPWIAEIDSRSRALVVALFLAVLQFPVAWVVPWQRSETLPTAVYIAASLLLISGLRARPWLCVVLFAGTVWQSFVRSDVPFILGGAMILLGLMSRSQETRQLRGALTGCGVAVSGIAGGIQAFLQFVAFPHAVYGPNPTVFVYRYNLTTHHFSTFAIALLPCAVLFWLASRVSARLDTVDRLTMLASVLYLLLWFTIGIVSEVRIFVPFFFALCPVAAKVIYWSLLGDEPMATVNAHGIDSI